jgi:hypothetical protein
MSDGQSYEDLFTLVMTKAFPGDFIPIKPQGRHGDRKNDGYIKSIGRYFQVFAPEDIRLPASSAKAVKKAADDFKGLKTYWDKIHPVREYFFVLNNKYESFPEIEETLARIKVEHSLDATSVFLASDLENLLFSLSDDIIEAIVGFIPNPNDVQRIDYSVLTEVINFIIGLKLYDPAKSTLVAPDFEEKIQFNHLPPEIAGLLREAANHVGELEKYFKRNGNFMRQTLRDSFSVLYEKSKDEVINGNENAIASNRFFSILDGATPNRNYQEKNAAIVLMSYYFESCDIYEEPA